MLFGDPSTIYSFALVLTILSLCNFDKSDRCQFALHKNGRIQQQSVFLKMTALISCSRALLLLFCCYCYSYEILENCCKQTLFLRKVAVTRNCSTYAFSITFWSLSNYQNYLVHSFTWKPMITYTMPEQFSFLIKWLPLHKKIRKSNAFQMAAWTSWIWIFQ